MRKTTYEIGGVGFVRDVLFRSLHINKSVGSSFTDSMKSGDWVEFSIVASKNTTFYNILLSADRWVISVVPERNVCGGLLRAGSLLEI